ncbi:MAG: hypothetical protein AB1941_07100 [Gemmatimonadota bacterium]
MRGLLTTLTRRGRTAARLILVASTAACTGWRPIEGAPGPGIGPGPIEHARLTLRDGRRVELRGVSVHGDSLAGFRGRGYDVSHAAFHVRDVARVERGEPSPGRTAIFVVALAACAAAAYLVADGIRVMGDPDY